MLKKMFLIALVMQFTACNYIGNKTEGNSVYPKTRDETQLDEMGKLTGEDGIVLFGGKSKSAASSGINVNSYLWRAALDTIHKMPLISADPFGGTILTDWYSLNDNSNERYKLNIYILGSELRSDALRVTTFKQSLDRNGVWRDSKPSEALSVEVENKILLKARAIKYKMGK